MACIVTSGVTHRLGSLSAMCGAAIAGGIGVAAALVLLEGGSPDEVSAATTSIVGNLAGMICDGAKIGCALKTMTGVDAAFRAASLALRAGLVIPVTDGIVGADGIASLGIPPRLITFAYQDSPAPWLRPHCDTRELHSYYGRVRQRVPYRYSAPPGFRRLESSLSPLLISGSIGTRLHTFHTRA